MNMPGFTAEASIYGRREYYEGAAETIEGQAVIPQSWLCLGIGVIYGTVHPILGILAGLACEAAGG